jgi:hypothetical protein
VEPILPVARSDRAIQPVDVPRPLSPAEREAARREREQQRERRRRRGPQPPPEAPGGLDVRV